MGRSVNVGVIKRMEQRVCREDNTAYGNGKEI
jgi:hypothetical protein